MGLFSANKSSNSTVSSVNQTRNSPTSMQDVETTGVIQAGINYDAGGNVTVTDSGAIQRMHDTAVASMGTTVDITKEALTYAQTASEKAMTFAAEVGQPNEALTKQQSFIVLGIVVTVAIAAAVVFHKG